MESLTTTSTAEVRAALAGIGQRLPDSVRACVFNLVWDEELACEVAIVVMILEYDDWNRGAEDACAAASELAWSALTPLGVIADVICRTQAEHETARVAEAWLSVDDSCN